MKKWTGKDDGVLVEAEEVEVEEEKYRNKHRRTRPPLLPIERATLRSLLPLDRNNQNLRVLL
jgi:hypothetical protein